MNSITAPAQGPLRLEPGLVSVRGLARNYGPVQALSPLDLDVEPGSVTGLLGPNGSGKSTLLRLLLGLVRPQSGEVALDGVRLKGDGVGIRRRCTYQPGEVGVYGEMQGGEHLAWFSRGRPTAALDRSLAVAEELGLPLGRRVRTYSQGMKRQLLFAASMGPDVRVRLLDEPTDGLDPTMRRKVLALLSADAQTGTTIFLSSHHLAEVQETCDRMVFLSQGKLLADEGAEQLLARSQEFVHLTWKDAEHAAAAAERIEALDVESVQRDERRLTVRVGSLDPGELVGRVAAFDGVPSPIAAEYGALSLTELYRELYGVEAL